MDLGGPLLAEMRPGDVLLVVGRPGSGVSTALASLSAAAASTGLPTLLASWECSPEVSRARTGPSASMDVPNIIGWDVGRLLQYATGRLESGSLVAVDYLQLIAGDESENAKVNHLRAWAKNSDLRVAVGAMAPRPG